VQLLLVHRPLHLHQTVQPIGLGQVQLLLLVLVLRILLHHHHLDLGSR
jgi:hypothetical protein